MPRLSHTGMVAKKKCLMKTAYVRMLWLQQVVNCGLSAISCVKGT
jgi:hypothetical protein